MDSEPEESAPTYDHLQRLYDNTIVLLMTDNPDSENLSWEDILIDGFLETATGMDPAEMPADVHEFLKEWSLKHGHVFASSQTHDDEPAANEQEVVKRHVESHRNTLRLLASLFDWIAEEAPKSMPPRIIECILHMYNEQMSSNRGCIAHKLYGADEDLDDPEEEDTDEEIT